MSVTRGHSATFTGVAVDGHEIPMGAAPRVDIAAVFAILHPNELNDGLIGPCSPADLWGWSRRPFMAFDAAPCWVDSVRLTPSSRIASPDALT